MQKGPDAMGSTSDQVGETPENFEPTAISPQKVEELKTEALKIKTLFDKFEEEFTTSNAEYYYILSKRWLNKWKRYVSYEEITHNKPPNEQFHGQIHPGNMNEDIVVEPENPIKYPEDDNIANVFLKDQIQAEIDYIIISEAIWKELKDKYQGVEVKRPVIELSNGQKRVEARLKTFNIILINNNFFRNIDHQRAKEFTSHKVQVPSQKIVKDFKEDILSVLNSTYGSSYLGMNHRTHSSYMSRLGEEDIRLWHLDPQYNLAQTFAYAKDICNKTTSYDYKVPFKGEFLEKFPDKKMEETNVAESDYVFVEIRESGRNWDFTHADVPTVEKCECCMRYGLLKYPCGCGKVAYCSEECKMKDKRFHMSRCTKAEEEEEAKEMVETSQSVVGLCGLQNLGNTCFMNGGLQCLNNFKELCEYFLSNRFLSEINETNPLGTQGKLVRKYANLIKNVWYGTSNVFSPWSFKHSLAQFQPMFSGYQQHDSQEFINFLLDGLHEDLNRVKKKPFVETLESEGRPDYTVAKLSWYNHLKRNQSIIVDLLHGQYKSQLTCPDCQRVSITFDPFMTVSLPIPNKQMKEIEFFYVHSDLKQKAYKMLLPFNPKDHLMKDLRAETAKILGKDPSTFYFAFLSQMSKEIVTDEDKTTTNAIRKKRKLKNLFAIEVSQDDLKIGPKKFSIDFSLTKKSSNYFGNAVRKSFTFIRTLHFESDYTFRQVYLKTWKYFRFLYDEYLPEAERRDWMKLSDEEAFKKVYENKEPAKRHFKILLVTNATSFQECYFCDKRRCENCDLECTDSKRIDTDLLPKIKDKTVQLEMELYFENIPDEIDLGRLNTCIDYQKKLKEDKGEDPEKNEPAKPEKKEPATQIYDCLRQFEQPEQLGEDNEWYCSKCKKHQRAFKKMEIYKAPPVIILHLKRFKAGGIMSSGKIQTLVDFPTTNLDLTEFVSNHELPMDYPITLPPRTEEEQRIEAERLLQEKQKGGDTDPKSPTKKIEKVEPPLSKGDQALDDDEEEKEGKDPKKGKLLYDLFGIVNHYGSMGFGHYTGYGKNWKNNRWYSFDDSHVSPENEQAVCTPAAYVLFYRRKDWNFQFPETSTPTTNEQTQNSTVDTSVNNSSSEAGSA